MATLESAVEFILQSPPYCPQTGHELAAGFTAPQMQRIKRPGSAPAPGDGSGGLGEGEGGEGGRAAGAGLAFAFIASTNAETGMRVVPKRSVSDGSTVSCDIRRSTLPRMMKVPLLEWQSVTNSFPPSIRRNSAWRRLTDSSATGISAERSRPTMNSLIATSVVQDAVNYHTSLGCGAILTFIKNRGSYSFGV